MMSKKYLALLRGINVSGKNPIKMKEFQLFLEDNEFENVKTYIQSGNLIFDYKESKNEEIAIRINQMIADKYNYNIPIIVFGISELQYLIRNNPFKKEAIEEPTKVLVSFLSNIPESILIKNFKSADYKFEKYKIVDKYVYLYCMNGYGKAKVNNNYLEAKLKVKATTRNWKTIIKLREMVEGV